MDDFYDYKKFYILYVDDEEKSLKYFRETFGDKFAVLTAPNAEEGFLCSQLEDTRAVFTQIAAGK